MIYLEVTVKDKPDMADYYMFDDLLDATSFVTMLKFTKFMITDYPTLDDVSHYEHITASTERR